MVCNKNASFSGFFQLHVMLKIALERPWKGKLKSGVAELCTARLRGSYTSFAGRTIQRQTVRDCCNLSRYTICIKWYLSAWSGLNTYH